MRARNPVEGHSDRRFRCQTRLSLACVSEFDSAFLSESGVSENQVAQELQRDFVAFDLDLVPRASFGRVTSVPAAAGDFAAPFLFIRSVGPSVYIIDDDQNGTGYDRVVTFTDGTGAGWDTYGETGSGPGQFQFMETSGL